MEGGTVFIVACILYTRKMIYNLPFSALKCLNMTLDAT